MSLNTATLIYLDHAATTPVDPEIVPLMVPFFTTRFGNPSSIYQLGQDARAALDQARARIAGVLGCRSSEIVFTSGATESDNQALKGVIAAWRRSHPGTPHVITTAIEHHAVLHAADALEADGITVTRVQCDASGVIDPDAIAAAIRPETALISVMSVNNEVGSIQPITAIGAIARERGIPFHCDAVQSAGARSLNVDELDVDLLSLSAHKFYGPKGVGILYVRKGTPIEFQQQGGGQESGRRGGTENVPLIVGMAEALVRAEAHREEFVRFGASLRDNLWQRVSDEIPDAILNGPPLDGPRVTTNLNIAIPGIQGETVLLGLDMEGVAASAGSACTTGNSEPSHVLRAMGLSDELCRASLRLTVGRLNTMDQMADAADALITVVDRVRALSGPVATPR
jgi:cysteine desulfurase